MSTCTKCLHCVYPRHLLTYFAPHFSKCKPLFTLFKTHIVWRNSSIQTEPTSWFKIFCSLMCFNRLLFYLGKQWTLFLRVMKSCPQFWNNGLLYPVKHTDSTFVSDKWEIFLKRVAHSFRFILKLFYIPTVIAFKSNMYANTENLAGYFLKFFA